MGIGEGASGGEQTNPTFNTAKVGNVPAGNYTEIEDDGTVVARGDATCWEDLVGSLIARRLTSTAGRLQYSYDENSIIMQNNGDPTDTADRLIFNYQFLHGCRLDSEMRLHIHWWQVSTNKIEWTIEYRIQDNGALKTEAWTTCTANSVDDSIYTYPGSGAFNQLTKLCIVDMTGVGISATVQFRLTRTDSTAGDIEATFVDAHIEINTSGSRTEWTK